MICTTTGHVAATAVERKGPSDVFASRFLGEFLRELGHHELQLQHDDEPSLASVCKQAASTYYGRVRLRATPRDSSASHGSVERFHRTLHENIRVLRSQVESSCHVDMNKQARNIMP
eukprot:5738062-Amphidinium_carterae.1